MKRGELKEKRRYGKKCDNKHGNSLVVSINTIAATTKRYSQLYTKKVINLYRREASKDLMWCSSTPSSLSPSLFSSLLLSSSLSCYLMLLSLSIVCKVI